MTVTGMPVVSRASTGSLLESWPEQKTTLSSSRNCSSAAHFDAESRGLDGLVGDAGDGFDAAEAERKAVDPAGGLAEALSGLAFLALQKIERAAVAGRWVQ